MDFEERMCCDPIYQEMYLNPFEQLGDIYGLNGMHAMSMGLFDDHGYHDNDEDDNDDFNDIADDDYIAGGQEEDYGSEDLTTLNEGEEKDFLG